MFLLNLSLGQFLALLGAGSALLVALYLLDRSRRRQLVGTLRFWVAAQSAPESRRRRRLRQWPSLLLQWLTLLLLLAALAQPRLGSRNPQPRDHVLLLDTSAWMAARSGGETLLEQARRLARAWLHTLPRGDRVMLVRVGAVPTPATPFTADPEAIERALEASRPGATALRLARALDFAERAKRGRAAGETVFIGAARLPAGDAEDLRLPSGLRFVGLESHLENCGLRRIALRRAPEDPSTWRVFVAVRNYGQRPHVRRLALSFGGALFAQARLTLDAGAEHEASFSLRTRSAGWLEIRLAGADALPADDEAIVELPALRQTRVLAYSRRPDLLRPLLSAGAWAQVEYRPPEAYAAAAPADLVILDRFCPAELPQAHAIWVEPPPECAPVAVRETVRKVRLVRWRTDHPVGTGLRSRDAVLPVAHVLVPAPGDAVVAEVEAGPVILARSAPFKSVVLGFHPLEGAMRYEVAAPLLFANVLRWMAPDAFGSMEVRVGSAGSLSLELGEQEPQVKVLDGDGRPLPFNIEQNR
ncbi:MAG: VWA domain-containing protein, partial [Bryobacteraceae bacterium]|nr:VWA domain-containing protein [Bryobacteraceae bacterium]